MRTAGITLAAALILSGSGCASILSGTVERISVSTSPVRADLRIRYGGKHVYQGPSPWSGFVRKRYPVRVEAKAEGYHTVVYEFKRKVTWWYRLNYLLLGLFSGVDKSSGATWVIVKPKMHITMIEKEPPPHEGDVADGGGPKPPPVEPPPDETPPDRPPDKGEPAAAGPRALTEADVISEEAYDG